MDDLVPPFAWIAISGSAATLGVYLFSCALRYLLAAGRLVRFASREELADFRVWRRLSLPHMGEGVGQALHDIYAERGALEAAARNAQNRADMWRASCRSVADEARQLRADLQASQVAAFDYLWEVTELRRRLAERDSPSA